MTATLEQTHRQAIFNLALIAMTLLACTGLLTIAALAPAPPLAQPLIVCLCVGFTAAMAGQAPESLRVVRGSRDALGNLRRALDELPEIEHPLGL